MAEVVCTNMAGDPIATFEANLAHQSAELYRTIHDEIVRSATSGAARRYDLILPDGALVWRQPPGLRVLCIGAQLLPRKYREPTAQEIALEGLKQALQAEVREAVSLAP